MPDRVQKTSTGFTARCSGRKVIVRRLVSLCIQMCVYYMLLSFHKHRVGEWPCCRDGLCTAQMTKIWPAAGKKHPLETPVQARGHFTTLRWSTHTANELFSFANGCGSWTSNGVAWCPWFVLSDDLHEEILSIYSLNLNGSSKHTLVMEQPCMVTEALWRHWTANPAISGHPALPPEPQQLPRVEA